MALISRRGVPLFSGDEVIDRHTDQSAANTELTVSTPVATQKLLFVTVKYSASVTKNITITLNSGAGAAWDTLLQTIALSAATDGVWIPDQEITIQDDDVIDVVAAAGGGSITSAVAIYTRAFP